MRFRLSAMFSPRECSWLEFRGHEDVVELLRQHGACLTIGDNGQILSMTTGTNSKQRNLFLRSIRLVGGGKRGICLPLVLARSRSRRTLVGAQAAHTGSQMIEGTMSLHSL
jgi:hypothetical protein